MRGLRLSGLGLLASLIFAACGSSSSASPTYTNPVYPHDFPDPFVLKVGTTYYAYATGSGAFNIPVLRSRDLAHWKGPTEALPAVGSWSLQGLTWAPSVLRRSDGRYIMYYVSHDIALAKQCIGEAVASAPTGPFRDAGRHALICPGSLGGAIDPAVFRDADGRLYLYWKNDGNCCGITTHIFAQRLSADGLRLMSRPVSLAVNDQSWEGDVIEGPTMWKHGNSYYLFYSGGDYATSGYAVGYSLCRSALGPCTDNRTNPILTSHCEAAGPGGEAIIQDANGATWLVYHAWLSTQVNMHPGRVMWIDRLRWNVRRPLVAGPTCSAQSAPST